MNLQRLLISLIRELNRETREIIDSVLMELNYIYYENLTAVKLCRLNAVNGTSVMGIPAEFEHLASRFANSANLIIVDDPPVAFSMSSLAINLAIRARAAPNLLIATRRGGVLISVDVVG